jgi:hypothetical protein
MTRWKIAVIIATVLYGIAVCLRVWANQLTHNSIDGDRQAFEAAVRWYTLRDLAILTGIYGLFWLVFLSWRRRT